MARGRVAPDHLSELRKRLTVQTQIPEGFRHLGVDTGTVRAQSKRPIERRQSGAAAGIARAQRLGHRLGQDVEIVDRVNPLCFPRQLYPLLPPLRLTKGDIEVPRRGLRKRDDSSRKTSDSQQRRGDRSAGPNGLRPDPAHRRAQDRRERHRDARHLQPEVQQVVG